MTKRTIKTVNIEIGKSRKDEKRNAKNGDIEFGNHLLVKNVTFRHKLTTKFDKIKSFNEG